jgi:transposase
MPIWRAERPFEAQLKRLDTIDGIDRVGAQSLLAELGPDMAQFPDADHLSSWAGMSPGNDESAGKRRSGKTTKGNKWLRRTLSRRPGRRHDAKTATLRPNTAGWRRDGAKNGPSSPWGTRYWLPPIPG